MFLSNVAFFFVLSSDSPLIAYTASIARRPCNILDNPQIFKQQYAEEKNFVDQRVELMLFCCCGFLISNSKTPTPNTHSAHEITDNKSAYTIHTAYTFIVSEPECNILSTLNQTLSRLEQSRSSKTRNIGLIILCY